MCKLKKCDNARKQQVTVRNTSELTTLRKQITFLESNKKGKVRNKSLLNPIKSYLVAWMVQELGEAITGMGVDF